MIVRSTESTSRFAHSIVSWKGAGEGVVTSQYGKLQDMKYYYTCEPIFFLGQIWLNCSRGRVHCCVTVRTPQQSAVLLSLKIIAMISFCHVVMKRIIVMKVLKMEVQDNRVHYHTIPINIQYLSHQPPLCFSWGAACRASVEKNLDLIRDGWPVGDMKRVLCFLHH